MKKRVIQAIKIIKRAGVIIKRYVFIVFVISFIVLPQAVFGDNGTTAANFLKIAQGNRATAMGGNFVSIAEGPTAVYWNPAGLANGVFNEGRLVYNRWLQGVYYGYAAYRHNLASGGFGAAVTYLSSGQIDKRLNGRESAGSTYMLQNIAAEAGQGVKVSDYVSFGASLKFIYETIDGESANALAAGFGGQFRRKVNDHLIRLGASVMNLGTEMGYTDKFPLPAVARIGAGDELFNGRLILAAETDYYFNERKMSGGLGMEFRATPFLDLRAGYKYGYNEISFPNGLTAGVGIRHIENIEYLFDVSAAYMGDLGMVIRIGTGIRF